MQKKNYELRNEKFRKLVTKQGESKRGENEKGITLIALIITIIVLLILAGVSIVTLTGDNGILSNTARAKKENERAEILEQMRLDIYGEMTANMGKTPTDEDIERIADNYGDISGNTFEDKILTTEKGNYKIKISDIWTPGSSTQDTNNPPSESLQPGETATAVKNEYYDGESERPAIIPEGFTVSNIEGEKTINGGLVIYYIPEGTEKGEDFWTGKDAEGIYNVQKEYDQYVWIPVDGILNKDGTIEDVNGEEKKILLGRYNWHTFPEYYVECSKGEGTYGNAIATDIDAFIGSVEKNNGYYIARYEASDSLATENRDNESLENNPMEVKYGKYVYNYITQPNASVLCQNLYSKVNSDLINSYAWDTAMLFIQKNATVGESYANLVGKDSLFPDVFNLNLTGKSSISYYFGIEELTNTLDKQCNIYGMASNPVELSTETYILYNRPCSFTAGAIWSQVDHDNFFSLTPEEKTEYATFRPILYL